MTISSKEASKPSLKPSLKIKSHAMYKENQEPCNSKRKQYHPSERSTTMRFEKKTIPLLP